MKRGESYLFSVCYNCCIKSSKYCKIPSKNIKIKPYISRYNCKDIDSPSYQKDWKKIEQNNKTIAPNILFVPHNTKTIRLAYKSDYNNERENQVILLMITNNKKWYYLALKSEPMFYGGKLSNRPVKDYLGQ